jgi:hypothetical protein
MRIATTIILLTLLLCDASAQGRRGAKREKELDKTFIADNFPVCPPSRWKPGERFLFADSALNVTLRPEQPVLNDTTNYSGRTFYYKGVRQQTDWSGTSTIDLLFESEGKSYRFESGKTLEQFADTTYNPLIAGLIRMAEIERADSLLRGKTLYAMTAEWNAADEASLQYARKMVPIKVTGVTAGDAYVPARVWFTDSEGRPYYIGISLSGTLTTATRYRFERLFSWSNPRSKHKEISDEVWDLITRGKLANGMTQEEVKLSVGRPADVERVPTYSGLREQWTYRNGMMIQFQDGRISAFRL